MDEQQLKTDEIAKAERQALIAIIRKHGQQVAGNALMHRPGSEQDKFNYANDVLWELLQEVEAREG